MVAKFSWVEYNLNATDTGVPTNIDLGSANSRNLSPSVYPITAGSYSYSKWVRGYWSGTFTQIDNIQFWMSASGSGYEGGESLKVSPSSGSYAGTSTYATPTSNADSQAAHPMPVAGPATANVGIGGSLSGSLSSEGYSDFIVIQASIGSGASAGAVQQKTFTLQYDET